MMLIDPLLNALGWDTADPASVISEYRAGNGRVDYALFGTSQGADDSRPIAFIEAKRLSVNIDAHRTQMLNYANMEGVKYACLTNGDRWEFYEVFKQAPLNDRRIVSISTRGLRPLDCALRLLPLQRRILTTAETASSIEETPFPTHYDDLGVEPSASSNQIRKAYLRKVKQLHPDVSKQPHAKRETARLNQAYSTLSNKHSRREYDASIFAAVSEIKSAPPTGRKPYARPPRPTVSKHRKPHAQPFRDAGARPVHIGLEPILITLRL